MRVVDASPMTKQRIEEAANWATKMNEIKRHIDRLIKERGDHYTKCKHWTTKTIRHYVSYGDESGAEETYERCEWCGKEWE